MHFGLIDKAQREELNWNGEKRRAFKGYRVFTINEI